MTISLSNTFTVFSIKSPALHFSVIKRTKEPSQEEYLQIEVSAEVSGYRKPNDNVHEKGDLEWEGENPGGPRRAEKKIEKEGNKREGRR